MPERLIQRHDQFAKQLLDMPGHADAFVRERLPAAVAANLAETPAIDRSESFIDPLLTEHRGDRVFLLESAAGAPLLVWVLVEHKSAPDPGTLIQMLGNLTGIACRGAVTRQEPGGADWLVPAAVYPILLYHGTRTWHLPTDLAQAYPPSAAPATSGLLAFRHTLVDLTTIPDSDLSTHPDLRAGLMVLKYALHDDRPELTLDRLLRAAANLDLTTVVMVVRYLVKGSDWMDREALRTVLSRILPDQGEDTMSPFMREVIEEARPAILAEGIARGRAQLLLRQASLKFGPIPEALAERVRTAEAHRIDDWGARILEAKTLHDLFGQPEAN